MSQKFNDVCKQYSTQEHDLAQMLKLIEQKKVKVQNQSKRLQNDVENIQHKIVLLDKKIICAASLNRKTEKEISMLQSETKDAACSLEKTRWTIIKKEMLKDFESKRNERIEQSNCKYENASNQSPVIVTEDTNQLDFNIDNIFETNYIEEMKEKINEMTEVIESKKKSIQMTDPKLYGDIKMLENRNAALLIRYQRKLQEAESRYRQKYSELTSLKKLLAEKDELLLNENEAIEHHNL